MSDLPCSFCLSVYREGNDLISLKTKMIPSVPGQVVYWQIGRRRRNSRFNRVNVFNTSVFNIERQDQEFSTHEWANTRYFTFFLERCNQLNKEQQSALLMLPFTISV